MGKAMDDYTGPDERADAFEKGYHAAKHAKALQAMADDAAKMSHLERAMSDNERLVYARHLASIVSCRETVAFDATNADTTRIADATLPMFTALFSARTLRDACLIMKPMVAALNDVFQKIEPKEAK